jgi:hypothetical protein
MPKIEARKKGKKGMGEIKGQGDFQNSLRSSCFEFSSKLLPLFNDQENITYNRGH